MLLGAIADDLTGGTDLALAGVEIDPGVPWMSARAALRKR